MDFMKDFPAQRIKTIIISKYSYSFSSGVLYSIILVFSLFMFFSACESTALVHRNDHHDAQGNENLHSYLPLNDFHLKNKKEGSFKSLQIG